MLEETHCEETEGPVSVREKEVLLNEAVPLKMKALRFGEGKILGLAGEPYAEIGEKIHAIPGMERAVLVASTERDHAGYIVSDRCADQDTFMAKDIAVPGDLEETIYGGIRELLEEMRWEN